MKVCPECHARFDAGETFCPNDATELVEARLLAPGSMTGTALENVVHLERLEHTDRLAERYEGRLVVSRKPVRVLVFNQAFEPAADALERVEAARARIGSPLPPQINTLLQGGLDAAPPYLIESGARGPSLRSLLEQKRVLDWRTAARITCSAARAVQWLGQQGLVHYLLHDASIHVTNLSRGQVQLAEWSLEQLIGDIAPMEAATGDPEGFVGFTPYMAPELVGDLRGGDLRSAAYALGALLYEMLVGKPPFASKSPAETLRRQLEEQPVKLSIARSGKELHPELDELVAMMMAKDPDKRFQAPAAIIAVLANLLGESPDEVAPPLQRAEVMEDEDIYATIEMSPVDRSSATTGPAESADQAAEARGRGGLGDEISEGSGILRKSPGLAAAAHASEAKPAEPDEPDEAEQAQEELAHPGHAVVEEASETEPGDQGPKKTLMMGSLRVDEALKARADEEADKEGEEEEEQEEQEDESKKTLLMGSIRAEDIEAAFGGEESSPQLDETPAAENAPEEQPEEEEEEAAPDGKIVVDSEFAAEARAAADEEPAAPAKPRVGGMEIGFVEVDEAAAPPADDWFSRSTEDAWENSLAREYQESSERRWRSVGIGLGVLLALVALGLILYFEFGPAPDEESTQAPEEATSAVVDTPEIDLQQLRNNFDDAMQGGRVIAPVGNSAVTYLEQLRRHADGQPVYEEAREAFVARARRDAETFDRDGDLGQARNLAGYASQFAPDDEELRQMSDDLQARYLGTAPDAQLVGEAAKEPPSEDTVDDEEAAAAAKEAKPTRPARRARPKAKAKAKAPAPKKAAARPAPTEGPAPSPRLLVSRARAAYSRGELEEAQTLYEQALARDAKNHAIHAGIGQVFFDRSDYARAVEHFSRAVRLKPGRADYRISLGQAYYRLERYGDAISTWEVVLQRDPNNRNARQYIELARRKLN